MEPRKYLFPGPIDSLPPEVRDGLRLCAKLARRIGAKEKPPLDDPHVQAKLFQALDYILANAKTPPPACSRPEEES